jgi:hypothetical protein
MDWLTDLIRQHPELAQVQARFRQMARQLAQLEEENANLRGLANCLREEVASLRCHLESLPLGLLSRRDGEGEAVDEDRSAEADEPIAVANAGGV